MGTLYYQVLAQCNTLLVASCATAYREMPITFKIDHNRERIYSTATGVVTFGDLYAHMNADVEPGVAAYSEIFDCTGATTDVTAADVRMLVMHRAEVAREQSPGPVAIVAETDLFFGLFRIFEMLTEDLRPINVFRDTLAAEIWLDGLVSAERSAA